MKVIKSLEITQKSPECVLNITFSVFYFKSKQYSFRIRK